MHPDQVRVTPRRNHLPQDIDRTNSGRSSSERSLHCRLKKVGKMIIVIQLVSGRGKKNAKRKLLPASHLRHGPRPGVSFGAGQNPARVEWPDRMKPRRIYKYKHRFSHRTTIPSGRWRSTDAQGFYWEFPRNGRIPDD